MGADFKIPFYAKIALISICIFAFLFFVSVGQHILIPIIYASMLAILLNPIVNFLVRKGLNKVIVIFSIVVLTSLLTLGVIYIISSQVAIFCETFPQLRAKFDLMSVQFIQWISEKFKIPETKINLKLQQAQSEAIQSIEIGERLTEIGRAIMVGVLLPVYLFMILYYKPLLLEFIRKLFRVKHHIVVTDVLTNIKKIIQSYLVGLFFEMIIVAILNSTGLLLLGIDYAILLGVIGAVINI
ncbi:MAG TPA: AI-2E family transporter, partial [Bacteroidia bacterium]|nr:AI-2E family transporter [Bacteroidia bacterium]